MNNRLSRLLGRKTIVLLVFLLAIVIGASWYHLAPRDRPTVAVGAASSVPPWIMGDPHSRYVLIEYADLECPYCRAYFVPLRRWIATHPDVHWQWHHLPLQEHRPAATHDALIAECAGRLDGQAAFWRTAAWIYTHSRGDGAGLPDDAVPPIDKVRLARCMHDPSIATAIESQAADAARDHITATPTLRLVDRRTGRTLLLSGAVSDDALLSALDLLSDAPSNASSNRATRTPSAR
ncbi:DsbA-thioredoxin family protein [Burkholderia pseudomallei]|uniref:DsbA family protein n=1 Tax=Burkholderia pseudomallei TaxID=28450 RepID=UPI0005E81BD8|nr:thioredoxin domain-containing protein [Burkholderia pseudomallei]CAJ9897238.1 DsbA-thioredoxin family protein [Burkholderia pseudomallei]CFL69399.1 DsbA-thioredoxin family protein [Burkholderia pseudomallei]CPI58421.1 DsbA-thioredoxin family protein [Burkholderia pseudomallei]